MSCRTYVVEPGYQLGAGPTGAVDCTAWAASRAIARATCGVQTPSGRHIRLLSDEAQPDPFSPGLNLAQVAQVALEDYGVELDVCTGWRAVSWAEYERRRKAGMGCIIQVGYGPIADSHYDAGRGFRGGHALYEDHQDTIDSLADGRKPGVYDRTAEGPRIYPRNLMRRAAGELVIAHGPTGDRKVGDGLVWAAFTQDVLPQYQATVRPRRRRPHRHFRMWHIASRKISAADPFEVGTTRGFTALCTPPRAFQHPISGNVRFLVQLRSGPRAGHWINAKFARRRPE